MKAEIKILEEIRDKQVISINISFVSDGILKDGADFCTLFNKTMHGNNCEIVPSEQENLLTINFNTPVSESKLREVIEELMVKMNVKSSEIEIAGWMTA